MFKKMIDLANSFRVAATNASLHSDGVVAYNFCADSIEQLAQLAPEKEEPPTNSGGVAGGQGTANSAMPKCDCGGEVRTVQIKYRCECGKIFRQV